MYHSKDLMKHLVKNNNWTPNSQIVITLIMLFVTISAFSQTTIRRTTDLRFIGKVKGEYYSDPKGMLQDFTLGIEWWTLLSEPVELYNIKWNSTGQFKIENKGQIVEISRSEVAKYPDLLKRFDNLKPLKIDLIIYGHANGEKSSVKRGSSFSHSQYYRKGSAYKKDGQSYDPYTLSANIVYKVPDHKLLLSKSGKLGKGLVPGSPEVWNYFWGWKQRTSNNSQPNSEINYLVLNKSESEYKALNENEQKAINKQLKHLYYNTLSVSIKVKIENLEWPEAEMRSIAQLFQDYETGKKEPSPEEKLAEAINNTGNVKSSAPSDEWLMPVESMNLALYQDKTTNLYGYKNQHGQIMISAKFYNALEFVDDKAIVTNKNYKKGIIDKSGNYLVEPKEGIIIEYCNKDAYVAYRTNSSSRNNYALFNYKGENLTGFKYSSMSEFKNGLVAVTIFLDDFSCEVGCRGSYSATVYRSGSIDANGNVVGELEVIANDSWYPDYCVTLSSSNDNRSYEQKKRDEAAYKRKKKREVERCKDEMEEWKTRKINQYK